MRISKWDTDDEILLHIISVVEDDVRGDSILKVNEGLRLRNHNLKLNIRVKSLAEVIENHQVVHDLRLQVFVFFRNDERARSWNLEKRVFLALSETKIGSPLSSDHIESEEDVVEVINHKHENLLSLIYVQVTFVRLSQFQH